MSSLRITSHQSCHSLRTTRSHIILHMVSQSQHSMGAMLALNQSAHHGRAMSAFSQTNKNMKRMRPRSGNAKKLAGNTSVKPVQPLVGLTLYNNPMPAPVTCSWQWLLAHLVLVNKLLGPGKVLWQGTGAPRQGSVHPNLFTHSQNLEGH